MWSISNKCAPVTASSGCVGVCPPFLSPHQPPLSLPPPQEVDLYTVTLDELTFTVPYSLHATRNDYIDALAAYFTVEFTKCHKRTTITTGQLPPNLLFV